MLGLLAAALLADFPNRPPSDINAASNPIADFHDNSGGRRIVRIDGTSIALAPRGSGERTYRSTNDGASWTEIDTDGTASGTLVSGPGEMVYHFYIDAPNDRIQMVRFRYQATPQPPETIFTHSNISLSNTGVYRAVNATIDANGVLFVATHWGTPDRLYLLRSSDSGNTWAGPWEISAGLNATEDFFYPHLEVDANNELIATFHEFGSLTPGLGIIFGRSLDQGANWTLTSLGLTAHNPTLLPVGSSTILIFAQNGDSAPGLHFNRSTNKGASWAGWARVEETCGYADPSAGLGSDGAIYVAFRSNLETGLSGGCGDTSRERLVRSRDLGDSWTAVDSHYQAERTGTRSQIRYQTWWNYGGPLEWIWMQCINNCAYQPIFYDINVDVDVAAHPLRPDGGAPDAGGTTTDAGTATDRARGGGACGCFATSSADLLLAFVLVVARGSTSSHRARRSRRCGHVSRDSSSR